MVRSPLLRDLQATVERFLNHDGPVMAGHLAYLTVLGLFPFLVILVALTGLFGNTTTGAQVILLMLEALPPDIQLVVEQPVAQIVAGSQGGALTLGLVGAVWAASSAIGAARMAIDRAYEASHPPAFWLRHLHGLGLVLLGATAMMLGFSMFVLGPVIWDGVTYVLPRFAHWTTLASLLRYGGSLLLLYLALVSLFFALKPRHHGRYAPVARGAFLTLLLWLAVGGGFSTYLKHFANYSITYGSLAGAIATLVFFYLLNVAFLLGAELNAVVARRRSEGKRPEPDGGQNTTDGAAAD